MPDRRALKLDRRTQAMGVIALSAAIGTAAVELARVWRRGSAELPTETETSTSCSRRPGRRRSRRSRSCARATRPSPTARTPSSTCSPSFTVTFGLTRATTALIRSGQGHGVLRDFVIADKRVHHFVPGIVLALASGGTSISVRSKQLDRWLALPFGAGAALVLDEAALLLELDDVYWTEEGVLSLQVSFGAIGMLAAGALAVRLLRRGESSVGLTPAPAP